MYQSVKTIGSVVVLVIIISLGLFAFVPVATSEGFLDKLGISKSEAERKIIDTFLTGYFDSSRGAKLKNLAAGDRKAVLMDALVYTKTFVSGKEFKDAYQALRESQKPVKQTIQSPDEMQAAMIAQLKKSVEANEESLKKADASLKPIFEETLASTRQMLKEAQDPNNDQFAAYRESYPGMLEMYDQVYQNQLAEWGMKYPENQQEYVKMRLQEFINLANDIDYSAILTEKNGKKVFQKTEYEQKDYRWKLGYRTGKVLMDMSRNFASDWLMELEK